MRLTRVVVILFALAAPTSAKAQWDFGNIGDLLRATLNWDFEGGLRDWTPAGDAFFRAGVARQPVYGDNVRSERAPLVPLGGDYWHGSIISIGHHGNQWIGTFDDRVDETVPAGQTQGNAPQGTLTSREFDVRQRFITFLIGGTKNVVSETVQLQVADGARWRTVRLATGTNDERMRREVWEVQDLIGRRVRIQIIDASSSGHINVDDFRFPATDPRPQLLTVVDGAGAVFRDPPEVLWGFADTHAHPMAYLGFGALKGIPTIWGRPGARYADYAGDPHLVDRDLPECDGAGHHGGLSAPIVVNDYIQKDQPHSRRGAPDYTGFPSRLAGAHHQMHITQIRRAYEGGLRLMSALVVNNAALEYLMSPVLGVGGPEQDLNVPITADVDVIRAAVCATRQLASANAEWMEIAYTPADARRIVGSNKLALVLGVELPRLGDLGYPTADAEVQFLYELGIRQVTSIHAVDNRIGGAAIFQDVYNSANDFYNRGQKDVWAHDHRAGRRPELAFFRVREGGCNRGPLAGRRGDCVLYRLKPMQQAVVIDWNTFGIHGYLPSAVDVVRPLRERYGYPASEGGGPEGHLNAEGLSEYGREYVRAMMSRGMVIDIAHMSEASIGGVWEESFARTGRPECIVRGVAPIDRPAACFQIGYPFLMSHAELRAQSLRTDGTVPDAQSGTTNSGFLPREFELSDTNLELLRRGGGLVGVFVGQDPIDPPPDQPPTAVANDCATSSKGFVYAFDYTVSKMGGPAALASDMGLIPLLGPRFGRDACTAYRAAEDQDRELERFRYLYRREAQTNRVRYSPSIFLWGGNNVPLRQYRLGSRAYDVNVDGLSHYGLLPDVLQDARNAGMTAREIEPLFSSAEAYVLMWQKAWRVAGCRPGTARCSPPPAAIACAEACHGLCPLDSP